MAKRRTAVKTLRTMAGLALAAGALLPAHAVTYVFSDSQTASFADMAVARLSITDIVGGTQWTFSGIYDKEKYATAFMHSLSYTYTPAVTPTRGTPAFVVTDFQTLSGAITTPRVLDHQGVSFSAANNDGRFQSGDVAKWIVKDTNAGQFSNLVAHLNAVNNGSSVKFSTVLVQPTSPVPEPSTWLMMGAGLLAVTWAARRRAPLRPATV